MSYLEHQTSWIGVNPSSKLIETMAKIPSLSAIRLIVALILFVQSPVYADGYAHDGGLWGSIKDPIRDSVKEKYEGLSDKGRFCVGMGVGFGCTKMVIRSKLNLFLLCLSRFLFICFTRTGIMSVACCLQLL